MTRWLCYEIEYRWKQWLQLKLTLPPPTIYWQIPKCYAPIYKLMWLFLWYLNVSGLKKGFLQRGHTNPTPKCTLHTWVQMVTWEVDGPSLQPSTWHLYTLLMPPNWMQRGCMWAGMSSSKTGGTVKRQTPVPALQEQMLQVLWISKGVDGKWSRKGYGESSEEEVRMWVGRSAILLPSEAHKNPLLLNQSLPLPSSLILLSPSAELHSQVCLPLCAEN